MLARRGHTPPTAELLSKPLRRQKRLSDDAVTRMVELLCEKPEAREHFVRLLAMRPLPDHHVDALVYSLIRARTDKSRIVLAAALAHQPALSADVVDLLVDRFVTTVHGPVGERLAEVLAKQSLPEHHVDTISLLRNHHMKPATVAMINTLLAQQHRHAAPGPT